MRIDTDSLKTKMEGTVINATWNEIWTKLYAPETPPLGIPQLECHRCWKKSEERKMGPE